MTTETRRVRRIPFKPRAVLAAFGLALALFPSAAEAATYFNVSAVSTAPASVDATAANVPVIYVDLTAPFDPSSLGSQVKLNLFGDVPANLLTATLWRDEGADGFSVATDTPVASASFDPPSAGFPARATLGTISDPPLSGGTLRYYFTVSFNGVPVGRKLSFGFQMSTDFSDTPNDLPLPFISNPTVVRAKVFANPSDGNYPTPTGGATRSGGLDTGLFVQAGQRVRSLAAPGILWNVSSSTNADGIPASEGVAFSSRGLLIGRIGAGQWIPLGQSSTITATSNGTLFVAANDGNYADNSGFVSVTFDILPSTTPKVWVGGTLGFETAADIAQNWLGGRPFNGESVLIGPGSVPIDWNLPNVFLSNLTVSTAYTGAFRLVTPPYHFNNRLTVDGNATISGGQFIIGSSSGTEYNTFVVKGRLVVKDTATLDASGAYLELGIGAEIRGAALLRAAQTFNIRRAIPSLPWYLRVDQGTVNVTASTTLEGVDYLDFINASVLAFDNATFTPIDSSTSPFARFAAGGPVNYTFNNWSAGPSGRSPAVHASGLPSGSVVVFNNSTAIGSTNFGSPTTLDPNAVVRWIPDGGGGGGSIAGTIVSPTNGTYRVVASTSPKGGDNTGLGGGGGDFATVSGSGGYSMTGLRTPSTYYLFAYINDGQNVGAHSPRGGFGHDGLFLSEPVYLSNGASLANIDINAANWGAVGGFVSNGSNQTGPMIVETWAGTPNIAASTRVARGVASPQTGYVFQTMVDASAQLFAFIDANRNDAWDSAFEASGSGSGAVSAASTITINVNITGGSAAPGGTVVLSTQAVHPGAVGRTGANPMIRSRLTASGSPAELSALTVRFLGGPPLPDPGAHFAAWSDNGDGSFNPALDELRGSASILTLGPSTYTITFSTPLVLPVGVPKDLFLTVDLANWGATGAGAGVMIDAATNYALSAGSFSGTPSFPSSTGLLPVLTVVRASETATPELQGGAQTLSYFFPGQMISVTSFGTWRTGPGDAPTGPGGAPGTTGLNTVLPSANRGELIGRVQAGSGVSSPWVRVGASSTPFASPGDGQLFLAINDFVGAYADNSGSVFAGFAVSGSSVGTLAGTVYYSTPVAGTLTVVARKDGTTPMGQTSFGIGTSSSASPFTITGLMPGKYEVTATNSANSDAGVSGQSVQVQADATTYLDAVMYQGVGSIAGSISYAGVLGQGAFHVRVATVTEFTGQVHFFGGYSNANSGAYSITSLPAPNTYYLVAYRDGDNNDRPNGTEPLGYYGTAGGSLSTLPSFLTPLYLEPGNTLTGVNATLSDTGAIEGSAVLLPSATGALVIETGRGVPGSALYVNENRAVIPIAAAGPPPGGVPYNLGLLRPATGYSLFAFVDKNLDGQPSAGEEQFSAASVLSVPSGGRARFDFSLSALSPPPDPGLTAVAGASAVTFSWNLVPGATGYQLRDAGDFAILHLSGSTSYYADSMSPNTASAIRGITASNGNGVSAIHRSSAIYTLAATPGTPVVSGMSALGATISWASSNPGGTLYELHRATDPAGVITRVSSGTATAVFNSLAPASTYFWSVVAENGNGVKSDFSALVSTVTEPLAGPSLAGTLSYSGFQTAGGRGFVIEASTSSTTFFPRASSAALPGAPFQPWFLQVPAGTYFTRAFVDLAGNGVLQPIADRGQTAGASVVAASAVNGVNFTVVRDTVPPGAPAGVLAIPGNNKVTLSWAAPTKNANNTNLVDLAGYEIERSTSVPTAFSVLSAVSSSALTVVDNFPIPGIANLYRVRAFDAGANRSSPSGAVSASPSSGGSISGQIRDIVPGTGEYRVRLSTLPSSSAASVAERSVSSFTFTGLADGVYYLRAFRDANFNGAQDPLTDPAGTFGGLNLPFPIAIVNGNAVSGADATICPRTPLQPPAVSGSLTLGGCPALDKGPGFVTSLYALSVGAGVQGSLGAGTQVNLAVSTATAFATDLILLGPDGRVFARDNRVGGANLTVTLSTPGIYLAELTSFQSGITGSFQLNMRLEGGFAGNIEGTINYSGVRTGKVNAQLFNQPSPTANPILTSTSTSGFPTPTPFSFAGLPDGTYYLRSFLDTNDNGVRDNGEPLGQYGLSTSSAAAVTVTGGLASGSPFTMTIADPAVGVIRGSVLYDGTAPGSLRVEAGRPACSGCSSIAEVVASTIILPGGVYDLPFIPSATDYVVRAFIDGNGNGRSDTLEPSISSFPINVFVNATSTVSLIVADAGGGAQGSAIVVGTVTYLGASTGPVIIGLSRDSQFRSVDYLITLSTTGYFERPGLQGGTSYYMAGFIDNNLNNVPDADQGEPVAAGALFAHAEEINFDFPPEIFVAASGQTGVKLELKDPSNGSVQGVVRYAGNSTAPTFIVAAYADSGSTFARPVTQTIARTVGVSTYAYQLNYLEPGSHFINAFLDANNNGYTDFGEPSGGRPPVTVSTGASAFPVYGADVEIRDPGAFGASGSAGRIRGEMIYLGTQSGPMFVRFFNNSDYLGSPVYTLRVPASGNPAPGSGEFQFDRQNLPFGTYYLDAFRDPSGSGVYNPAVHAYGVLNNGFEAVVSAERNEIRVFGGTISDPGQAGSVNAFTGSFASAGGARFDGGATDLGVIVAIDSTTANGPQPIVLGVTAQNDGINALAVRYDSAGVMLSSRVITVGDLQVNSIATDNGSVYIPYREEDFSGDQPAATATLVKYNEWFAEVYSATFPDYQGFDGLAAVPGGFVYAASRYLPTNEIRALKIDAGDFTTLSTGSFAGPGGCEYCYSRAKGAAASPDGSMFLVYAVTNQQNDDDRGLHFLIKFNGSMVFQGALDITGLGVPSRGDATLTVDNSGQVYLVYSTDGDTARTVKFDASGATPYQSGSAAYAPIRVQFSGGLGNVKVDPITGDLFQVWQSTTNGGDYVLLRYNPSLTLIGQTFFDGLDGTQADTSFSLAVHNPSTVFVTGAVNNGRNLDWGTVKFDGNASGSVSAPGAAVAITTSNAVNYISGTVTYGGSLVTSGTVRMSLIPTNSYVPIRFATGTFGGSTPFLFNNVPDGQYDVRAFIDNNGSQSPEEGEPVGASTLYGIDHAAESGSQVLEDNIQLCDRRQIAFDADVLHSLTAADCTSPDRPGAARRLYTFRGTRGQPVTITMKAIGFYDSYIDLYDPNGDWAEYDDDSGGDGNAQINNFILPQDGVYTIDAGAYAGASYGQFRLSLSGSAGALGGINGRVNYSGSQGGSVIVGLFDSPAFSSATSVGRAVLTTTRAFAFNDLPVGTTFYLGAFIDVNANNAPDQGEDGGVFGAEGAPTPILLASGQIASGLEIAVNPSTAGAATISYVTGVSTYTGTRTGSLVLEFWSSSSFQGRPIASRVVPSGVGSYDVAVPGGVPYFVRGYIDANNDFALQPDEPRGVYAPNNQGAEPVFVPVAQTLVGIDLTLKDPGVGAGGGVAGAGTAVLSSTFVVSGAETTLAVTYTAAVSSIASGGQVGFTAPPGFPFPIFAAGVSSVTATSTATALSGVTYSGPSAFVTVGLPGLALGQTVRFVWSNFPAPCAVANATFTVSAAQNAATPPQPLFVGSPALAVVAGPARQVSLDEPYFSVKAGERSSARRLETRDQCGTRVAVAAPLTVDLRTRRFDGSNWVADPEVGITTNTALSTDTVVAVNFAVGQSSRTFFVLSASTGFKNLELHYNLGFDATYYFGLNSLPADALTAVTVSTAASGAVALSSASIGLAANGQPNQLFVNFRLGDSQQPWRVLVSSLPFKAGETPVAIWERGGFGQPNPGEVAWDGRYLPWINGGARVPNGLYYGRVEVGSGSGVKDDSLRLTVALPQFAGTAYDPGTVPNPPLSGVRLSVYGPAGYFTAETAADGSYVLPGLGAGSYRLNTARADYVDGSVDLTLNASGAATSFVSRTTGLLVSSNAAGGLDLFVGRAPRLTVVPSLDPSVAAVADSQWGSLQVRPSTSNPNASTFYGPMRLKGGTTTFDDGGQWDSASQSFIEKTLLGFNVPVGTYTVIADLTGYSRATGTVFVGVDGARLDLTPFLPKAVVTGTVNLDVAAPAGGLPVGISAIPLSAAATAQSLSGGTFINAGSTWAFYSISGFEDGAYLLRANTQGLSAVTTGPIVVAGTAAVNSVNFSTFGAGGSITGTISVTAPNGTRVFINAWAPGSFNFGSTVVYVNANAADYALNGLDSGVPYQLYASIESDLSYDVDGGFPRSVTPPATDSFQLKTASGVISGVIILRAGATDFANVTLSGVTIASLKPNEVGHTFVELSTTLPNFLCGDGSSGATGYCPAGVSSATFRVQGVNTETLDLRFLHSTTGQSSRHTVSAVNGATVTVVSDLSASTYSISGFLINQITDAQFNTNEKIVANAPYIKPEGYPVGLSSTTARVTAVRQDIDNFGVAISTVFDPVTARVGFLDASGAFTIPNVANGVYVVRTTNLRSCATCAIVVPAVGRLVTVSGAAVSSVTLTVSNGFSVSGTISLDGGVQDARVFQINVLNKRQEIVRSTVAYLGDLNLGAVANSVAYSFTNLPSGEFYTLTVRGQLFPIKYAGRPIKFPDAALSPNGLQANLTNQNVLMQRAAYIVGRLKDGKTGELVTALNATLLAPNFGISATANPWTEGGFVTAASSVSARPIEADGYFRVGPLVPDVSYDLRLAQTTWDPNFLASGSQNYAPVTIGGLKPTPGEIRDVGIVALGQGQSLTGVVRSTGTLLPLGNIKVTARPSFGDDASLVVQTFTNSQGIYSLWVSSIVSNQFTLVAAPRDGNQASDGRYYGTVEFSNINLQTQTTANFILQPLAVVVTGQVLVADAAAGGALSYPFGDKRGFPAAAINLQPVGVVSKDPLGDISATTVEGGRFSVPGLSTGVYRLNATSLGYSVYTATVQVIGSSFSIFTGSNTQTGGILTLARGATATGRILKSDGTSPNSSEVVGVAAANFGAGEFVVGSVETDPVAKTVNAYTISGFKPGISYNIVLLSGANGKEVSFPTEGAGVVFSASESTTTKTLNLTYRPARLDCLATAKALNAARTSFLVQVDCLKPLRQATAADDDLTTILTVSTFTAAGTALVAPNGAGVLSDRSVATTRRLLTATYTLAALETRFSIRIRASAAEIDPNTGDSFAIDKVFDFYAGLESSADGRATNINGGKVGMKPSAQDELLGLDERSGIDLPPGAFTEGDDTVANPTTTVNISMAKGRDQAQAKALSIATLGYAPAALQLADTPSAVPEEMWAAMSSYRTMASTTQVGGANPISAFYSIFLPAGIRHQLKQRADLTLSYSLATSTSTSDDKIQVWFYNAVLGRFVPETVNRRLDTVNKTITVSVDHFSTFVVLDSTPVATSTVSFGGVDLAVANFPNPADCIPHSNIARNSTLFGSGGVHATFTGTMLRTSVPLNLPPRELKYNIYTVAGEKIRTIEQGVQLSGQTYYTPWNCKNDGGGTVASGVYIGEVTFGDLRKFFKIAIIKGSGL